MIYYNKTHFYTIFRLYVLPQSQAKMTKNATVRKLRISGLVLVAIGLISALVINEIQKHGTGGLMPYWGVVDLALDTLGQKVYLTFILYEILPVLSVIVGASLYLYSMILRDDLKRVQILTTDKSEVWPPPPRI